jgi:aspartate dehydrogenase
MSVGGLVKDKSIFSLAEEKGSRIYIPTGAISGLDCVKAAKVAGIDSAMIITRKPPKGLAGAPYILENNIDLEAIEKETIIFEGTAKEAVSAFPKNINVAAALSFAGIGIERTRVRIMASKEYKRNSHEIVIEGVFGKMTAKTENLPSPQNPKTSYLAVLSAVATLEGILGNIKVGT